MTKLNKRKTLMKVAACLALLISVNINVFAGGISSAKINNIMLDKNHGIKAYIELSKDMPSRDDASCHNSGRWEYVVEISTEYGEKLYSNLLVAYSTQKPANFSGTGECLHAGIEELRRLELLN
jgi:hypothetical protein